MRFAIGLRQVDRIGALRNLATVSFTALLTLSAATAFARTPSASGSWPPAPDPRGSAEHQRAAAKAAADKAAADKAAADKAAADKAAADKAAADKAAADKAAAAAKAAPPAAPAPAPGSITTPARGATAPAAPAAPVGIATIPAQTPTEKRAAKMSADALGPIYRARGYKVSEMKLREAIRICGPEDCSQPFQARLHRDLGYLYIDGLKRVDDGKDEFTLALTMDPTVILTDSMLSLAVTQAFAEIKKLIEGATLEQQAPAAAPPPASPPPVESKDASDSGSSDSDERVENWLSFSLQQDFVFHSKTTNVCSPGSAYKCFDALSQPVDHEPNFYVPGSNQISSGGAIMATTRVLLGYDRVVLPNVTIGAKLGSVIAGKALRMVTDRKFLFFHGEVRAALWIGSDPFTKNGFRPYVYLSAGMGEADGKITVDYMITTNASLANRAVAWKRSGTTFVSPGVGLQYAISKNHGPVAEFRYMQFMSPNVPVVALNLGYSYGF